MTLRKLAIGDCTAGRYGRVDVIAADTIEFELRLGDNYSLSYTGCFTSNKWNTLASAFNGIERTITEGHRQCDVKKGWKVILPDVIIYCGKVIATYKSGVAFVDLTYSSRTGRKLVNQFLASHNLNTRFYERNWEVFPYRKCFVYPDGAVKFNQNIIGNKKCG